MLIVSNYSLCKGWKGQFNGEVGIGGDCSPIKDQLDKRKGFILKPNILYLGTSQFVHESLPTKEPVNRVLIHITLPATAVVEI